MVRSTLLKTTALCAILCAYHTSAFALQVPYGWYADVNIGKSEQKASNTLRTKSVGTAGNANVGYKFMPFFGLEAGYTRYAQTRFYNSQNTLTAKDEHRGADVAAKVMLPFGLSGFEVFGKAGLTKVDAKYRVVNQTAANLDGLTFSPERHTYSGKYYAAGVDYSFNPNFSINAQWSRAHVSNQRINDMNLYTVGILMYGM